LRYWDDATVDLRRELPVYFHLFVAGGFAFRQRRVIEVRETDGALDLQRAVAFEKNRRCVGIDAMDIWMLCRICQERENRFLHAGIG
jgi:hypothetical protein